MDGLTYVRSNTYVLTHRGTYVSVMTGWVLEGAPSMDGPWQTLDHRGTSKNVVPMHEHQVCVCVCLCCKECCAYA